MDSATIERHAEKLRSTGLAYFRRERDGSGNVIRLEEVPWEAVLVHVARAHGWTMVEKKEATVAPLRLVKEEAHADDA